MKKLSLKCLIVLLFSILLNNAHSQDFEFNRVLPDDGGDFESVTDITQDKDGFIWFTSKKGLNKYDGNKLTSYVHDPLNPNSISDNLLLCIEIDNNGEIWLGGLTTGLDQYNPKTGIFTHHRFDTNNPNSIANDTINDILIDRYGKLWIATQQGLDLFDPNTNQFTHFRSIKNDPTTISDRQVRKLYEDKQGTLWIGTGSPFTSNGGTPEDGGLNRFNKGTGNFTRYLNNPDDKHSLINNKISAIFEDNSGDFWIGTGINGLHKMNREKGTFKRYEYDPKQPEKFSIPNTVKDPINIDVIDLISQDTKGAYWIGTLRTGLYYFNPKLGKMRKIQSSGTDYGATGFIDVGARSAFTSYDGSFWIGGRSGNLYRINPFRKTLPNYLIPGSTTNVVYEENDSIFWVGTGRNLFRINQKNDDTTNYATELNYSEDTRLDVFSINKDLRGNLWVGARTGLYIWDSINYSFKGYRHDPDNEHSLNDNNVLGVYEDSQNNFWVGTFTGLNLMDRETGNFTYIKSLTSREVPSILEDKSGNLWFGVWHGGGINLYNRETKTFKTYLKGSGILCIYQDSEGVLWAGGDDGLFIYQPNTDNFIRFGDRYIPNTNNLIEDNQKNLWIGTNDGLVKLNPQRNEPTFIGENYGIEKKSLSWMSAYKGLSGAIYFAHDKGYYKINPLEFMNNLAPPKIYITGFQLSDQEIQTDKKGPLKNPINETKEIKLNYNQRTFSFDITIIDYINPEENRLLYYLEDYDNDWIQANNIRRAYYFDVPPGQYVFRVKGANSDGVWVEKKIEIIIKSPWYKSWLAYGIYALLIIAGLFAFDRIKRKRIIQKERLRAQEKELAQAREIEKAYTELKATQTQLIQSEKMASLGELTAGIAHEIQNPLNFVNNFSEVSAELIDEMNDELDKGDIDEAKELAKDIKQNLEKINHHGKRADSIVKGMLQHSRTNSGERTLIDINVLADEYLRLSYHGLRAKDKSFNADFKLEADENIPKVNVVGQDIGRVMLNLINNAFYAVAEKRKSAPKDYKPKVIVSTKQLKNAIEIKVSDNGSGIPKRVLDKIFQPFFTTKPTGEGTGLGLSMSYDIIKAHGGELKVESSENLGTEFKIKLPNTN